jgi:hypothetical protein
MADEGDKPEPEKKENHHAFAARRYRSNAIDQENELVL